MLPELAFRFEAFGGPAATSPPAFEGTLASVCAGVQNKRVSGVARVHTLRTLELLGGIDPTIRRLLLLLLVVAVSLGRQHLL